MKIIFQNLNNMPENLSLRNVKEIIYKSITVHQYPRNKNVLCKFNAL